MTGAVYAEDDSNAFFGGEAVFANNAADFGGTRVYRPLLFLAKTRIVFSTSLFLSQGVFRAFPTNDCLRVLPLLGCSTTGAIKFEY